MEVGCGDGTLLRLIQSVGFTDVFGIDPGQPAGQMTAILPIASGYFPGDVPAARRGKKYDLIVARHVLEHLEMPREFVASVAMQLKPAGQLWIEVPDLACTVHRRIWSNFYQIHCSYFEAATLDGLLAEFGLTCCGSEVVEIFGGSLLHRYQLGSGTPARGVVAQWEGLASQFSEYRGLLGRLAEGMPAGCVGYGAAERTAVALGACPTLEARLSCLYDGNPLLAGRFLGGTSLPIFASNELFRNPPSAIVLFAISHVPEVIAELKAHLPGGTPIGLAGADFRCLALDEFVGA
jgi:hypothetical protein